MAVIMAAQVVSLVHLRARLREQDAELLRQADQIARLKAESERLSNLVARAANPASPASGPSHELLRLRGEVGVLRQQTNELGKLRQENINLSQAVAESETNQVSAQDQLIVRRAHAVDAVTTLLQAIKNYATRHNGQYPGNLNQLITSGDLETSNFVGNLGLNDFQFGQAAGTDPQGNPAILRLQLPKPGGGALMIVGEFTDDGIPRTSTWNVGP